MYLPSHFKEDDPAVLLKVMQTFPFATVISNAEKLLMSHLPIVVESRGSEIILHGHMARANPHWRLFLNSCPVTIAFHGPHTYINPSWYTENDVPTWNYLSVHATGAAKLVEDYDELIGILKRTTHHMNAMYSDQWDFFLPEDLREKEHLTGSIIGFSITNPVLQGKFKLNQNRSLEDRQGVIRGLRKRKDDQSRAIGELMQKMTQS